MEGLHIMATKDILLPLTVKDILRVVRHATAKDVLHLAEAAGEAVHRLRALPEMEDAAEVLHHVHIVNQLIQ